MKQDVIKFDNHIYQIDVFMENKPGRMSCYYIDSSNPILIEVGPSNSFPYLISSLESLGINEVNRSAMTHLHLDHIKLGLRAGLQIFAEKPIVISEKETFELAKLIKEYGKERIIVGLVLRYSQQARSVRKLLDQNAIGNIISIEASEHIVPSHGAFFMRNWRRKQKYSGGFMLEKCCHDIDFYSMITKSRPIKVASFGSRRSFIPDNLPEGSHEQYTKDRLKGWESKSNVFDSDADIVDHQVAIIEYANKAVLSFHTNMKVPDEFRRFAVMGSAGMIEGDFVRGFMKAHDENNNILIDEDYGAAFGKEIKGHYGADSMMAQDINNYLLKNNKEFKDLSLAAYYFDMARKTAIDPEQAAKACYMAAKCTLIDYYHSLSYQAPECCNNIPYIPEAYAKYYDLMLDLYGKTTFYEKIITECQFFRAYAYR